MKVGGTFGTEDWVGRFESQLDMEGWMGSFELKVGREGWKGRLEVKLGRLVGKAVSGGLELRLEG